MIGSESPIDSPFAKLNYTFEESDCALRASEDCGTVLNPRPNANDLIHTSSRTTNQQLDHSSYSICDNW